MDTMVVSWLMGHAATSLGYLHRAPTFKEFESGDVEKLHLLQSDFQMEDKKLQRMLPEEELMVWHIMAHADSRGSDVRLSVGSLCKPDRAPRQSVNPAWWRWRTKFPWRWQRPSDHISEKELQCASES